MKFQTKLCFYSDETMKEFQLSHSHFSSSSEMDSGTNVKVENGTLTYNSLKYGQKSYSVKITSDEVEIKGFIKISEGAFHKCE